jgi:SAM-dependent methyltransferase
MTNDEIVKKLNELAGPRHGCTLGTGWYQEIDLNGIKTAHNNLSNISCWERIRSLLPQSIEGKRILDIGCNAGLFSIMPASEGASVIGLDNKQCWLDQAEFILNYFTSEWEKPLDVDYYLFDVSEDDLTSFGHFDYTFLIGVAAEIRLSHGEKKFSETSQEAQKKLITNLTKVSDSIIVRSREKHTGMHSAFYTSIFNSLGWHLIAQIPDVNQDILLSRYSK